MALDLSCSDLQLLRRQKKQPSCNIWIVSLRAASPRHAFMFRIFFRPLALALTNTHRDLSKTSGPVTFFDSLIATLHLGQELPECQTGWHLSDTEPPHSRAYDRCSKFLILEASTPNSHRPFWTVSKTDLRAALAGYWRDPLANARHWPDARQDPPARDTQRDSLASYSGLESAGFSAGSTACSGENGELLWWDTRRDPLASYWRAGLVGYSRRHPLAGCSGEILGGVHWRAALAGYSAGSTGEPLWRDTWRDPLASSGAILGGRRAGLAGYSAGSTGELLWRDTGRAVVWQTRIPT